MLDGDGVPVSDAVEVTVGVTVELGDTPHVCVCDGVAVCDSLYLVPLSCESGGGAAGGFSETCSLTRPLLLLGSHGNPGRKARRRVRVERVEIPEREGGEVCSRADGCEGRTDS